ncbi:MAG: hypothetical protein QOI01_748 [Mycobacterium sp.]|jgi:DNA-binding transcriptional regulator YdaS (Cro superfamily)|nr:hypothetical protein [Mycobacterium sp.]
MVRLGVSGDDIGLLERHVQVGAQSELSRLSGVRQPSISQFLSAKVDLSDERLDRLLSCMGYRLEVTRRPVVPDDCRRYRRRRMARRARAGHHLPGLQPRGRGRRRLRAANELHEDLSAPIDEVIEEARSQQAARVTALEAELEAARKALADLD